MTNKNIGLCLVASLVVLGLGAYVFSQSGSSEVSKTSVYNSKAQGKVVFGVTDATSDIEGVSSIFVTVNKVEVHNAINGWVTVSNAIKEYDLLVLKQSGAISLLANTNLNTGTYDQVRLMISKVVVVKNGISQEAKLPSGELKIVGNLFINADQTSSVVFDFKADKSLHLTGNGKFIFAPVVKILKQNDIKIEFKSNNEVSIKSDKGEEDEDFGMDEKGEIKVNFELKGDLKIDAEGDIRGDDESKL